MLRSLYLCLDHSIWAWLYMPLLRNRNSNQSKPLKSKTEDDTAEILTVQSIETSSDNIWPACWLSNPLSVLEANEFTMWNSREFAPGWIRLDFGTPCLIHRIKLLPSMEPKTAQVEHVISLGMDMCSMETLCVLKGTFSDREWIVCNQEGKARFLHVLTTSSPSWVAWIRIVVLGRSLTASC